MAALRWLMASSGLASMEEGRGAPPRNSPGGAISPEAPPGSWSIFAARMKSFSVSPPAAWVQISTSTVE